MDVPDSISELMRKSLQYDYSTSTPFSTWLDIADCFLEESITSLSCHNHQKAYVDLTRFIDLILNKLPNHPDFHLNERFEQLKLYEIPEAQTTSAQILNTLIEKAQAKRFHVASSSRTMGVDDNDYLLKFISEDYEADFNQSKFGECADNAYKETNNQLFLFDSAANKVTLASSNSPENHNTMNNYNINNSNNNNSNNNNNLYIDPVNLSLTKNSSSMSMPIPIPSSPKSANVVANAELNYLDAESLNGNIDGIFYPDQQQRPAETLNQAFSYPNIQYYPSQQQQKQQKMLSPATHSITLPAKHHSYLKSNNNDSRSPFASPLTPEKTIFALSNDTEPSLFDFNNANSSGNESNVNGSYDAINGIGSPLSPPGSTSGSRMPHSRKRRNSNRYSYHFDKDLFWKNKAGSSGVSSPAARYMDSRRHSICIDKMPRNSWYNNYNNSSSNGAFNEDAISESLENNYFSNNNYDNNAVYNGDNQDPNFAVLPSQGVSQAVPGAEDTAGNQDKKWFFFYKR